jgi:CheY-like chemotaxis protein
VAGCGEPHFNAALTARPGVPVKSIQIVAARFSPTKPGNGRKNKSNGRGLLSVKSHTSKSIQELVRSTRVLVVDDDYYMRKVIRSLLQANGIKTYYDAQDGVSGLEAIITLNPDVVILDWDMPDINGAEFMRIVRSPLTFPAPAVPIIMLTGQVEREKVIEAVRLGVNEFLCKPVSAKTIFERIVAIRVKPREMVRIGDYYGPAPRKIAGNIEPVEASAEPAWLAPA